MTATQLLEKGALVNPVLSEYSSSECSFIDTLPNHAISVEPPATLETAVEPRATLEKMNHGNRTLVVKQVVLDALLSRGTIERCSPITTQFNGGKLTGIVGPSQSAVTKLFQAIAGTKTPASGQIRLHNHEDTISARHLRNHVAILRSSTVLRPSFTVLECLRYRADLVCRHLDWRGRQNRVADVMQMVDLVCQKNTLVGDEMHSGLSTGQRKRLAIAQELLSAPDVLLLENPITGLDSTLAVEVVDVLRHIARKDNKIVVLSLTHMSSRVYAKIDTLQMIVEGNLVYRGSSPREYFVNALDLKMPKGYGTSELVQDICAASTAIAVNKNSQTDGTQLFAWEAKDPERLPILLHPETLRQSFMDSEAGLAAACEVNQMVFARPEWKLQQIVSAPSKYGILGWIQECTTLVTMFLHQSLKRKTLLIFNVVFFLLMGVMLGAIFHDLPGRLGNGEEALQEIIGNPWVQTALFGVNGTSSQSGGRPLLEIYKHGVDGNGSHPLMDLAKDPKFWMFLRKTVRCYHDKMPLSEYPESNFRKESAAATEQGRRLVARDPTLFVVPVDDLLHLSFLGAAALHWDMTAMRDRSAVSTSPLSRALAYQLHVRGTGLGGSTDVIKAPVMTVELLREIALTLRDHPEGHFLVDPTLSIPNSVPEVERRLNGNHVALFSTLRHRVLSAVDKNNVHVTSTTESPDSTLGLTEVLLPEDVISDVVKIMQILDYLIMKLSWSGPDASWKGIDKCWDKLDKGIAFYMCLVSKAGVVAKDLLLCMGLPKLPLPTPSWPTPFPPTNNEDRRLFVADPPKEETSALPYLPPPEDGETFLDKLTFWKYFTTQIMPINAGFSEFVAMMLTPQADSSPDPHLYARYMNIIDAVGTVLNRLYQSCNQKICTTILTVVNTVDDVLLELFPMGWTLLNVTGCLFAINAAVSFFTFDGILSFPEERVIFNQESANRVYHPSSYYVAKSIADLPFQLIPPVVSALIWYAMAGLQFSPITTLLFCVVVVMVTFASYSFNMMVSAGVRRAEVGMVIAALGMVIMLLFSGFVLRGERAQWLNILQSISLHRWGYFALMSNQFPDDPNCYFGAVSHPYLLQLAGVTTTDLGRCIGYLTALSCAYRVIGYLLLRFTNRGLGVK